MELWGVRIDKEILLAKPIFLNLFLVVSFLAIIKVAFGKDLKLLLIITWNWISKRDIVRKIDDWTAICITRQGWIQKADGYPLKLENKHLKKLSFEVSPMGRPANWRGGFILGNEKYQPQSIIDTNNSLLFHVGAPPPITKAQHVWYYNRSYIQNHPFSTTVTKENGSKIRFQVDINDNNWLRILINGQQIYNSKISPNFRNKAYLLAWGDYADCKVKFMNIKYSLSR